MTSISWPDLSRQLILSPGERANSGGVRGGKSTRHALATGNAPWSSTWSLYALQSPVIFC